MTGYLRGLEQEFGESSNAIRLELNRFHKAGMLHSEMEGNKKVFRANQYHPLFEDLNQLIKKYVGIDQLVDKVVAKSGNPEAVYLTGQLANGIDGAEIEIIIVGTDLNQDYLIQLAQKATSMIKKKVRWIILSPSTFQQQLDQFEQLLLIWHKDNSSSSLQYIPNTTD